MPRTVLSPCLAFTAACFSIAVWQGCASAEDGAPVESAPQSIVNGTETNYEQWKGVVGLFTGMSICTATLIAPDIALSAGHCVFLPSQNVNYVKNPQDLMVIGGPQMASEDFLSYASKVIKHPQWQGNLWGNAVDLSLIKLENPAEDQPYYHLREAPSVKVGDKGWIVGYGKSYDDGNASNLDDDATAGIHRAGETTVQTVQSRILELGSPTSTCQGDSGGPFFSQQNGKWVVTGVTSFGQGRCFASGGGWDVNVLTYRKWIETTFEELAGYPLSEVDAHWGEGESEGEGEGEGGSGGGGEGEGEEGGEGEGEGEGEEEGGDQGEDEDGGEGNAIAGEPQSSNTGTGCATISRTPAPGLLGFFVALF
ncbi:MAG: trypsin-like serine protease [Myxococcota bacterium]|jgi:V8-like Glu-specific endopeptidase|nr:trypsin-like serine protease [Myxococcota bacterium]